MKKGRVLRLFQLSSVVTATLFLAGVVAPSLIRTESATERVSLGGSLQTMNIAGVSFSYKLGNIYAAALGVLFGTGIALVLNSLPRLQGKNRRVDQFTRLSLAPETRD
jgi:hypothetical protein